MIAEERLPSAGVVLLAANSWDDVKMADRHLAECLSRCTRVLYVDPPMSRLTPRNKPALAASLVEPRLRDVTATISRLTPVVTPFPERPGIAVLTRFLTRRALTRAIRALGMQEATIVATSPLGVRLSDLSAPLKVYWAQDDFVGGAALFGLSPQRIAAAEDRLARDADLIISGTPGVDESWRARGFSPVLVPYGCDATQYANVGAAPVAQDIRLEPPIVGFVGHLGSRIDIRLLEAVAAQGHSLLLVGPRHPKFAVDRIDSLLSRSNVQWAGPKPFDELPSYFRAMDVGLVPYGDTPFNRGSFPLKTLEYLAAGLPVVATALPATRWLDTDLIRVADEPGEYAAAVSAVLESRVAGEPVAVVAERQAFAALHTWDVRAQAFLDAIELGRSGLGVDRFPSRAG